MALMFITTGAQRSAFKSKRTAASCLADEIIAASKGDVRSFAMNRKDSVERVAKAAR
jgi:small subunit ribosomal protein S7